MHNQLDRFIFVIALAFPRQPLGLFPMGFITFALCFNFSPCTGFSLASRPVFAANEAVSLPFAVQAHFCLLLDFLFWHGLTNMWGLPSSAGWQFFLPQQNIPKRHRNLSAYYAVLM